MNLRYFRCFKEREKTLTEQVLLVFKKDMFFLFFPPLFCFYAW